MAEYKVQRNKVHSTRGRKIAGIVLIAVACLAFFFLLTNLVPALQNFLLGTFGYFAYPLFVGLLLGGVTLLNSKKYKISKKYAVFLYLTIFFLMCIIQLAVVGNKAGTFGEYLASNYTRKHTAGGIIFGFFTTCILYLTNFTWAFVIFSVCFVISLALYIDSLIYLRKKKEQSDPVKLSIKEVSTPKLVKAEKEIERPAVNVVMSGNIAQKASQEEDIRQKLGLTKRTLVDPIVSQPAPQKEPNRPDPKNMSSEELRQYLLTPPEVDINRFFDAGARSYVRNGVTNSQQKNEIDKNISSLKQDNLPPIISDSNRISSVKNAEPEQLVSEADDIIREVMQENGIKPAEQMTIDDVPPQPEQPFEPPEAIEPAEPSEITRDRSDFSRDRNDLARENTDFSRDRNDFSRDRSDFSNEQNFMRDRGDFSRDRSETGEQNDLSRDRGDFSRERSDISRDRTDFSRDRAFDRSDRANNFDSQSEQNDSNDNSEFFAVPEPPKKVDEERLKRFVNIDEDEEEEEPEQEEIKPYIYTRPPIDLITTTSTDMSEFDEDIASKSAILENTLQEFGVPAKVQNVVIGPAVTRYELEMPMGITVKKILNLSSDIALALEANGGDVRIEAPVPGRNVVGIEVPNDKVSMVSIKDVLISNEFNSAKSPLAFAVGKDITGRIMVGALNKMPHLLIAGTTGSGKSVMLNSIIISLLYKATPDDCKLLLIDPKQVEFTPYEGIPHLIVPKVISEVSKAVNALQWALDEMERRFRLLREARAKDIEEYNYSADVISGKKKKMPFVVIIIDEFSDFIMQGKKEVEDRIIRLGQKARACGIHLILATQYPTTEYVTGGIKANFPSRIAFKVASRVNSDVILGMTGAEKLLGHGDMLYAPTEYSAAPKRVQGCYITTKEISDIVSFVTLNNEPIFDKDIQDAINNMPKNSGSSDGSDKGGMDPLLPEALKMCIDAGQASTSMIQRRLSIGYPRAGKIIDQMTEMGYISTADGAKARNVYISLEEFYQIFGENYD